jgi:hypothetical protein
VLISVLGTGDALKSKINAELTKQGLTESTGVTNPVLGNPPRDVAELQVAPRASAKLKISGTQYELEIRADTFLGACNISLEALTYSTTLLTFLDLSFVHRSILLVRARARALSLPPLCLSLSVVAYYLSRLVVGAQRCEQGFAV